MLMKANTVHALFNLGPETRRDLQGLVLTIMILQWNRYKQRKLRNEMSKQSSKFFLVTRNCIDSFLHSFREASHLTGQQRNRAPVLLQGRGCSVARQDVPALACTLACSSVCCVLVHALVSEQTDSCDSRHGNFSPKSGELHVGGEGEKDGGRIYQKNECLSGNHVGGDTNAPEV